MAIELTEQVRERLEGANFWSVATVMPDGAPHATPMWVGLEDGLIVFNTSVGRIKEENLRHDPRVHSPTPTPRTPTTGSWCPAARCAS